MIGGIRSLIRYTCPVKEVGTGYCPFSHTEQPKPPKSMPPEQLREEFPELYCRYWNQVYAFFRRRYCSVLDSEDLAQETFIRAYRSFPSFDGRISLQAWLVTIMTRVWIDDIRKRTSQKRQRIDVPLGETFDEADSDPASDPEHHALEEEQRLLISEAIDTLPPKMRQCFLLWYQGMSGPEIALALEIKKGTVRSQIAHAIKAIRAAVKKKK